LKRRLTNVGPQCRGEGLAEQDVPVLAALPLFDPNLAVLQINIGDHHVAQLRDPDHRVEEQPQHQGVLNILGPIHDAVEAAELIGVEDTRQPLRSLAGPQVARLPHLLRHVPPAIVVETFPPHDPSDLGDDSGFLRFRFSILRSEIGRVSGHLRGLQKAKVAVEFRELTLLRN
jgi:hypothetical protein